MDLNTQSDLRLALSTAAKIFPDSKNSLKSPDLSGDQLQKLSIDTYKHRLQELFTKLSSLKDDDAKSFFETLGKINFQQKIIQNNSNLTSILHEISEYTTRAFKDVPDTFQPFISFLLRLTENVSQFEIIKPTILKWADDLQSFREDCIELKEFKSWEEFKQKQKYFSSFTSEFHQILKSIQSYKIKLPKSLSEREKKVYEVLNLEDSDTDENLEIFRFLPFLQSRVKNEQSFWSRTKPSELIIREFLEGPICLAWDSLTPELLGIYRDRTKKMRIPQTLDIPQVQWLPDDIIGIHSDYFHHLIKDTNQINFPTDTVAFIKMIGEGKKDRNSLVDLNKLKLFSLIAYHWNISYSKQPHFAEPIFCFQNWETKLVFHAFCKIKDRFLFIQELAKFDLKDWKQYAAATLFNFQIRESLKRVIADVKKSKSEPDKEMEVDQSEITEEGESSEEELLTKKMKTEESPNQTSLGTTFNISGTNYKVVAVLKSNEFVETLVAISENDKQSFVLKRYFDDRMQNSIHIYEILQKNPHPNIMCPTVCSEDQRMLVFPYFDHTKYLPKSREHFRSYMKQLLLAISHLRTLRIAHGDISYHNVLYNEESRQLKLIDFDMAVVIPEDTTKVWYSFGTAGFISPEVDDDRVITLSSDVYSVGMLLLGVMKCDDRFSQLGSSELTSIIISMANEVPENRPDPATLLKEDNFITRDPAPNQAELARCNQLIVENLKTAVSKSNLQIDIALGKKERR